MKNDPNKNLIYVPDCGCDLPPGGGLRFLVLSHMGTTEHVTAADLGRLLTPRELDACALHLADGWPQATVADWLGLSRRGVQLLLASATAKVPSLGRLRVRGGRRQRRPRVMHLSQLGPTDRDAFHPDDL